MAPPTDLDDLLRKLRRIGDPYLALPAHAAAADSAFLPQLEALLLESARLRLVFAALPFCPSTFLRRLIVDARRSLTIRVAGNPSCDASTLDWIYSTTKDAAHLRALASHPNASSGLLRQLALQNVEAIRVAVIRNNNTMSDTLDVLLSAATDNEIVLIARHPNATTDLLDRIVKMGAYGAVAEVLESPNCPRGLLEQSCMDPDPLLRSRCAGNPHLTPQRRLGLLEDRDPTVRLRALATLSASELPDGIETKDKVVQVRRILAERFELPKHLASLFAFDSDPWVRRWLARNSSLNGGVLSLLALDDDEAVRRGVGRNPICPSNLLSMLARDGAPWVRAGVASRPDLPQRALRDLEGDVSVDVLSAVGRNPSARPEALLALSQHVDAGVRRSVIFNPATALAVLRDLYEDDYPFNRALLIRHRDLPLDEIWALRDDPEPEVRFAVGAKIVAVLSSRQAHNRRESVSQRHSFEEVK